MRASNSPPGQKTVAACTQVFPPLVLASSSPRRKELLRAAGIAFTVQPTAIAERRRRGESPRRFALRMAEEKAAAVLAQLPERQVASLPAVLGADTVVVIGDRTLGKPRSEQEARAMLRLLSGRRHRVLTAVCLLCPAARRRSLRRQAGVASTLVKFARLSEEEIRQYAASGEPLDKAGAYAIQGLASRYVERIEGCYFNVVGLPVSLVYGMLRKLADASK